MHASIAEIPFSPAIYIQASGKEASSDADLPFLSASLLSMDSVRI